MPEQLKFPHKMAKALVRDLFEPDPRIYWADFFLSAGLGWTAVALAYRAGDFSPLQVLGLLIGGLALYRAVLFVHELSHLKRSTFRAFTLAWNLLCGIPLLFPSFLYVGVHPDHHKWWTYGTRNDPEYFAFALAQPRRILVFLATMFAAPCFFILRFLVLTPLSYLFPVSRGMLWIYASSLAVGGPYRRTLPEAQEKMEAALQEAVTFLYAAAWTAGLLLGALPWKTLVFYYVISVVVLFTNALRSLVAHCDRNPPDHVMTFEEQFLDSTDIPGNPLLTPLWAPLGLRYHATHHVFPSMPYHNLGEAHRRLLVGLPADGIYPLALRKGLWQVLKQLWWEASLHQRALAARRRAPSA